MWEEIQLHREAAGDLICGLVVRGGRCVAGRQPCAVEGPRSPLGRRDDELLCRIRSSLLGSGRTYGARPVRHDDQAVGRSGKLHRVERLMGSQVMRARTRHCRLRATSRAVASAVGLDRSTGGSPRAARTADWSPTSRASNSRKPTVRDAVIDLRSCLVDEPDDDRQARHGRLDDDGLEARQAFTPLHRSGPG